MHNIEVKHLTKTNELEQYLSPNALQIVELVQFKQYYTNLHITDH